VWAPSRCWLLPLALVAGCVDLSLPSSLIVGGHAPGATLDGSAAEDGREQAQALGDAASSDAPGEDGRQQAQADGDAASGDAPVRDSGAPSPDGPRTDGLRGPGVLCSSPWECSSDQCVDGVCCATACGQACHACNLPSSPGTCLPQPSGAICGAATCSASSEQTSATCDSAGSCVPGYLHDCGPYACMGPSCGTTCSNTGQCTPGYACSGSACVVSSTLDAAPVADATSGVLTVDDFSDGDLTKNSLGGAVTFDNETPSLVAGEQRLVWTGAGSVQDFNEAFRANRCEYDISGFTKLRIRLRSSTVGKRLVVLLSLGDGACKQSGLIRQTTISLSTTMASYEVDLSRTVRDRALFLQFAPTAIDTAEYFVDDIVLVP
jgi:hypothetical protein